MKRCNLKCFFQFYTADVSTTTGTEFTVTNPNWFSGLQAGQTLELNYEMTFEGDVLPQITAISLNGEDSCSGSATTTSDDSIKVSVDWFWDSFSDSESEMGSFRVSVGPVRASFLELEESFLELEDSFLEMEDAFLELEDSFLEPMEAEDSFLEPMELEESFLEPMELADSFLEAIEPADSFLEPMELEDSFLELDDSFLELGSGPDSIRASAESGISDGSFTVSDELCFRDSVGVAGASVGQAGVSDGSFTVSDGSMVGSMGSMVGSVGSLRDSFSWEEGSVGGYNNTNLGYRLPGPNV